MQYEKEDEMLADAVNLASRLVKVPSISPDKGLATETLYNFFDEKKVNCMQHLLFFGEGESKTANLWTKFGSSSNADICFAGHLDVVDPGNLNAWSFEPFCGEIKDQYLLGRGTTDMKSAIAAFAAATINFYSCNKTSFTIAFLISGNEEGDPTYGTPSVLEYLKKKNEIPKICLVGEPTSSNTICDTLKTGRRGSINICIKIAGKQGHVAYLDSTTSTPNIAAKIALKIVDTIKDTGDKLLPPTTVAISELRSDFIANNITPGDAQIRLAIRYNNNWNEDSILKHIENICSLESQKYEIFHKSSAKPFISNSNTIKSILKRAIYEIVGIESAEKGDGGTSDARFIKDYCPVIELGMLSKYAHAVDEKILISDLEKLTKVYRRTLEIMNDDYSNKNN